MGLIQSVERLKSKIDTAGYHYVESKIKKSNPYKQRVEWRGNGEMSEKGTNFLVNSEDSIFSFPIPSLSSCNLAPATPRATGTFRVLMNF